MSLTECLSRFNNQNCLWFPEGEKRNTVVALLSSLLFFSGWWLIIDVNTTCWDYFKGTYHLCGIFGTVSMIMVNMVSNAQMQDNAYGGGFLGSQGAKIWLFLGFSAGFAAIIAACWILFADFVTKSTVSNPIPQWAGVGLFLQNCFIFIASLVYKFGRTDPDAW